MNTDNTSISGETLDYGPCAFLDEYDSNKKFSSIDRAGRYAFGNQPRIAQWNMAKLAEALLPVLGDDEAVAIRLATERVNRFPALFEAAHARVLGAKLGLHRAEEEDAALASDLFERLAASSVDFTVFFRRLCLAAADPSADAAVASLFSQPEIFHDWAASWRRRLATEDVTGAERASAMRRVNPAFIPRNHRVEEVIQAAVRKADFEPFETLVRALERPYEDQPEMAHLAEPPKPDQRVRHTFCGT